MPEIPQFPDREWNPRRAAPGMTDTATPESTSRQPG
jgi:hypothetical protein